MTLIDNQKILDFSKIPSTCTWYLQTSSDDGYWVELREKVRGRTVSAYGRGATPQEAVDNAIKDFTA